MARDCRYASLVILLDLLDGPDEGPCPETPRCDSPAVFSTVIVRERVGGPQTIPTRTCAEHDAGFRSVAGYRDSIRLPAPPPTT